MLKKLIAELSACLSAMSAIAQPIRPLPSSKGVDAHEPEMGDCRFYIFTRSVAGVEQRKDLFNFRGNKNGCRSMIMHFFSLKSAGNYFHIICQSLTHSLPARNPDFLFTTASSAPILSFSQVRSGQPEF